MAQNEPTPSNSTQSQPPGKKRKWIQLPPILPPDQWQIALQIADKLQEPLPILIAYVIKCLGLEAGYTLLQQTLDIEAQGGLMLPDGSRRRTPGGVYLFLAKQQLSPEAARELYYMSVRRRRKMQEEAKKKTKSESKPHTPAAPSFAWEERESIIPTLLEAPGTASTAKVLLVGRPELYKSFSDLALITLTHPPRMNSLPRGIPRPESGLEATYSVLIGMKQWKKVEAELQADENDLLVIEGLFAFSKKLGRMAVYATNATTRNLQIRQGQEKRSRPR